MGVALRMVLHCTREMIAHCTRSDVVHGTRSDVVHGTRSDVVHGARWISRLHQRGRFSCCLLASALAVVLWPSPLLAQAQQEVEEAVQVDVVLAKPQPADADAAKDDPAAAPAQAAPRNEDLSGGIILPEDRELSRKVQLIRKQIEAH